MEDELDVVVATTAFGMGIDKPGTRFVIHAEEELQQVAGLVVAAPAVGLEDGVDVKTLDEEGAAHPAEGGPPPGEAAAAARALAEHHEKVDQSRVEMMRGYAETTECRRQFLLGYFGEHLDQPCGNCDNCTSGSAQDHPGRDDHDTPFPVETPVEHSEWGKGVVMRVEDDRITVLFDEVGYKTLALAAVLANDLLRVR